MKNTSEIAKHNFYDLPSDILSKIYQFDGTFHGLFSTGKFLRNLKRTCQKMVFSDIFIKEVIEYTLESNLANTAWDFRSRCSFKEYFGYLSFELVNRKLSNEFNIFLFPKDKQYTKFKILRQNDDSGTIHSEGDDFDGFVCNDKQMTYLLDTIRVKKYDPCEKFYFMINNICMETEGEFDGLNLLVKSNAEDMKNYTGFIYNSDSACQLNGYESDDCDYNMDWEVWKRMLEER
jgi:hypothetical protein